MRTIQVYGPGCANCQKLYELAVKTVKNMDVDFSVEKIQDMNSMVQAGILRTPALGFDGEILIQGKIPTEATIKQWIQERMRQ